MKQSYYLYLKVITVGFWCQAIHKKVLQIFDTFYEIKMMVKIYAIEIIFKFHEPFQRYQLADIANSGRKGGWLGQIASNSEGACGTLK